MSGPRSRARLDDSDESMDELAGSALLDNIPQEPIRASSLYSHPLMEDVTRPKSSRSNKATVEDLDKPLPPIPRKASSTYGEQHRQTRPALATKTTNMKVFSKGRPVKPKISSPIPQDEASTVRGQNSRPPTSQTSQSVPGYQSSIAGAADLSRKITNLMQQAAAQEEQTKRNAAIYAKESAKPSPLQRSKKAFVKATRAIKDRLSGSSHERSMDQKAPTPSSPSSSHASELPPEYETDDENRKGTFDRRIAEGENLSNPKIQSMMGDGNIPRKPLPVYESMKYRGQGSDSLDDPFSDGNRMQGSLTPQEYSGFDFDFNKRKHKSKTATEPALTQDQLDASTEPSHQHLAVPQSTSRFSNMVSGLAQHSDLEFFSSSPVGYSTPRTRLEPKPDSKVFGSAGALLRSPSILEFSFEAQSDDGHSEVLSTESKSVTDESRSIKRKSASEDLRSQPPPPNKKPKVTSKVTKDEAKLAVGISKLDTEDERAPLSTQDKDTIVPPTSKESKGRGLSIFEMGKGKAAVSKDDGENKKSRPRAIISKRSSIPRPGSMLFGRESRNGMRRLTNVDQSSMDIDELQTDDVVYQVRGKKK